MIRFDEFNNMPLEGSGAYPIGTNRVTPPPLRDGSTFRGDVGTGMQIASGALTGYSAIRQASALSKAASKQYHFGVQNVYETYAQVYQELGDHNRRMYEAQDVAVATSGLAMEGSVMQVLDEAVQVAKKTRKRQERAESSQIAQLAVAKRAAKKDASRMRKYGVISSGLQILSAGYGG